MYYELYIDVFFFINFMMDSLLLMAVKKVLRCSVRNRRVFLGGALGAGLTCMVVALPLPAAVKIPVYYAGINGVMLRIGLKVQKGRDFLKAFVILYTAAFLMGGILWAVRPWLRAGSLFFAAAVPIYYLLCGIWQYLTRLQSQNRQTCEVILYMGVEKYRVYALVDTGNGLTDPVSGEPVSVIDPACARQMLEKNGENTGIRYIPYRTVSGDGVMQVFRAGQMKIILQAEHGEYTIRHPVIGICEGQISGKEDYQMILNPDVLP